jgi:ribosomal protein S18 acetylase RimI-like enzyme
MTQISSYLRTEIRPVTKADQQKLISLMHFEHHVHRHLDWISPVDLVDSQPFFVLEQQGQVQAALACPIDPPGVAWIRVFVASGSISYEAAWQLLWAEVRESLRNLNGIRVVAIALHQWMSELLIRSEFKHVQDVVFLAWNAPIKFTLKRQNYANIRTMKREDLPEIQKVDEAAFSLIWRNSTPSLSAAYEQSYFATVLEDHVGIYGYQISTAGHMGGHLARLAVHPRRQGQKSGYDLLVDLLRKFYDAKINKISVNTQKDNYVSLNLYHKVGFQNTNEEYGVYEFGID